jgi:Peptidase propeptide and YPEB domain
MKMNRRTKLGVAGAAAVLVIGAGSFLGIAAATGGDDEPLSGETRDRAVAAALASTGGGTVTETEAGDDGATYEVEVRKADGSQVEVQLNSDFGVIGSEADDDGGAGEDD